MVLLHKDYPETVVSIEMQKNINEFQTIATGFLVGFKLNKKNESGEDLYSTYIVTNKHVFENKKEIWLRFNLKDIHKRYPFPLLDKNDKINWLIHKNPKVDLAVAPISLDYLNQEGVELKWISDKNMLFTETIKELNVSIGDEVFVLGFPMGLSGQEKKYVVVRGGIIARLDDEIIKTENYFLIDAFIFPGNSGGPVILKPTISSVIGTKPIDKAYLIGIVKGYLPYEDVAYSLQTNKPRVIFTENSGLASIIPLDYLRDIVKEHMSKIDTITMEHPEGMKNKDG